MRGNIGITRGAEVFMRVFMFTCALDRWNAREIDPVARQLAKMRGNMLDAIYKL